MSPKAALVNTLDYNAVRIALVTAMQYALGLDQNHVIEMEPEIQNVPRPTGPYMAFKIIVPGARFGDDDKRVVLDSNGNPTQNWNSGGPRMMTVSFNAYGGQSTGTPSASTGSHETAYNLMALWQAALDEENTESMLRAAGIAVWTIGAVADMSELLNTGYEGRAHMDCTFGLASNVSSNLGEMDSVTVVGTVDTGGGVTQTITETVTKPDT